MRVCFVYLFILFFCFILLLVPFLLLRLPAWWWNFLPHVIAYGRRHFASFAAVVQEALRWERDQWTDGGVSESAFYAAPVDPSNGTPGTLLRLEEVTNASAYTLPPATVLSRFIYQSETLDGTKVPVPAYILWLTSSLAPNNAPSHHENLWRHFWAPYNLALQGYVVVATDYAGLGVGKTLSGEPIVHGYLATPAQANDVIYFVQAAQQAFSQLGKQFVVIGISQGGAAAWSVAQHQVAAPLQAILPIWSILALGMMSAIAAYFPGFNMSDVFTPEGLQRSALVRDLGITPSTSIALLFGAPLLRPNWTEDPRMQTYQELILTGGRVIAQPLLVIKGEADPILQYSVVAAAIQDTLEKFPDASVEFIHIPGISHDPALTSSQWYWMDWIADRFAGKEASPSLKGLQVKAARPLEAYQPELTWFLSSATRSYQTGWFLPLLHSGG
ncbi:hypothetical protein K458DRAFT_443202 [Lentithecium fluviatile CBS 122367]|uniref:AB hydrolase-1 domain-containing protein n=1 Tax=Lentithecium fluviatile CBS 122367 TaxID=1168545 RepID=A0A6G1J0D3_9PLEO|nr:hypothetical protein K458DRAFT_443202 [Lentithecium fluviatile CBS 122367]